MFAVSWVGTALASCAATCACNACGFASREVMRRSARLAYCFLFTMAMILAWVLRDFAKPLMEKIPCKPSLQHACLEQNHPIAQCFGNIGLQDHSSQHNLDCKFARGTVAGFKVEQSQIPCYLAMCLAGIVYHGSASSESFYGQQAVYRVSLGNFVSPHALTWSLEELVAFSVSAWAISQTLDPPRIADLSDREIKDVENITIHQLILT